MKRKILINIGSLLLIIGICFLFITQNVSAQSNNSNCSILGAQTNDLNNISLNIKAADPNLILSNDENDNLSRLNQIMNGRIILSSSSYTSPWTSNFTINQLTSSGEGNVCMPGSIYGNVCSGFLTIPTSSLPHSSSNDPIQVTLTVELNNGCSYSNSFSYFQSTNETVASCTEYAGVENFSRRCSIPISGLTVENSVACMSDVGIAYCCQNGQEIINLDQAQVRKRCETVSNLQICPPIISNCLYFENTNNQLSNSVVCLNDTNRRLMSCCAGGKFLNSSTKQCEAEPQNSDGSNQTGDQSGDQSGDQNNQRNLRETNYTLNDFDPLLQKSGYDYSSSDLTTPAGIINRLLVFAFPLAGLILFVMIVWGGFKMLMQATSKKSIEDGKKIITNAVIGFMLLFVAYWVMQIIEVIFGIKVL